MSINLILKFGFPGGASGKESACQCRRLQRLRFYPLFRKIPRRRKWQPTSVFLPGKFHGQKSLAAYSPWGCKGSDTSEYKYTQNEYKIMAQWCSKVHLEPLLPEELLSPAIFSEMEHIQMAASKEPSSALNSALFYAPNAWCQDLSVRHCAESTQQLLAWTSQELTCWALSGT